MPFFVSPFSYKKAATTQDVTTVFRLKKYIMINLLNRVFSPLTNTYMSFVKIWVHAVWGTKNKYPYLTSPIRPSIFSHICSNASDKGIFIQEIGGYHQHVHCLLTLAAENNIAKVIQLLKGESSYWINKEKLVQRKFEWADEYYGVSVSESHVNRVRNYIRNQEEHHKRKSWDEEVDEFLEKYGFSIG